MSAKAEVLESVGSLPDDATMDDIAEMIAILMAARQGRDDIANGRFLSHEAAKARIKSWTTSLSGPSAR